jgi:hypothetical protein
MQLMKDPRIQFLIDSGAAHLPHSGRTLLQHLIGTARQLKRHGRPQAEVLAGLFHSVYATDYYGLAAALSITRASVLTLIGNDAESLVYIFCNLKPRRSLLIQGTFREPLLHQLRWIEYCNMLDQNMRSEDVLRLARLLGLDPSRGPEP